MNQTQQIEPAPRPSWWKDWRDLTSPLDWLWIAQRLDGINRFGNRTPLPHNVLDHSLDVELTVMNTGHESALCRFLALLHDVHEIWIGDICRPVKSRCGDVIAEVEREIDGHLWWCIGIKPAEGFLQVVKAADERVNREESYREVWTPRYDPMACWLSGVEFVLRCIVAVRNSAGWVSDAERVEANWRSVCAALRLAQDHERGISRG